MMKPRLVAVAPANRSNKGHPTLYAKHVVRRLTAEQSHAFKEVSPCALWIAGNLDGPQPRRMGDNLGGWPVEIGLSQRWSGLTEANQFEGRDPYNKRGVMVRVWCQDYDTADRLQCALYQRLVGNGMADRAQDEWLSLDADLSLTDLSGELLTVASEMGIDVLTDDDLIRELNALISMARKLGAA